MKKQKQIYAGFWLRLVAYLIDAVILSVGGFIIGFMIGLIFYDVVEFVPDALFNLIGMIVGWLYYALMESSVLQATLGKMALGLKVTDLKEKQISFGRATGRHFAKYISLATLGIGFIMIGFTKKKQGLHDMIASCLVVRKKK